MAGWSENDPHGCFVGAPVTLAGTPGGMAIAVKDNIDVAGLSTGAGLGRAGPVTEQDAAVVRILRGAGVTLIGKTRLDEAALGGTGDNPHHGRTANPCMPGCSPGGSSSGSAAAVAAGLCPAALGTDTLGSVRIPAAYCGLVGLKPTRGLLPMAGVVPLSRTLDHVDILANSVDLAAQVLALLTGPASQRGHGLLRVGVPDALDAVAVEPALVAAFEATMRRLAAVGWTVERCAVPGWHPAATRRAGLLLLEAEGAVEYAGLLATDDRALSAGLRALLTFGRDCGTGRLVRALHVLQDATTGLCRALKTHEVLATPTVPAPAFAWADGAPDHQADLTALPNFGGQPAISVPGTLPDGRPWGLQLIGRAGAEWRLLEAARTVEALG